MQTLFPQPPTPLRPRLAWPLRLGMILPAALLALACWALPAAQARNAADAQTPKDAGRASLGLVWKSASQDGSGRFVLADASARGFKRWPAQEQAAPTPQVHMPQAPGPSPQADASDATSLQADGGASQDGATPAVGHLTADAVATFVPGSASSGAPESASRPQSVSETERQACLERVAEFTPRSPFVLALQGPQDDRHTR